MTQLVKVIVELAIAPSILRMEPSAAPTKKDDPLAVMTVEVMSCPLKEIAEPEPTLSVRRVEDSSVTEQDDVAK
jgi:hypothetical protein